MTETDLSFYFIQFVTGLASACSLFLVASGLSIIFGVTRIVNFAHGAFYMLGAYVGFTLTDRLSGAVGFWGAIALAAIVVAMIGTLVEIVLLRRIYNSPELFQLLATFGVTLAVEDLVLLIWGPSEFLAALGGALELPREAANHTMDLQVITETLVVVVIGGLGSVAGTFLAAIIVSELNAFGILVFPKISIVLVFLVMALVLIVRPWGLLGRAETIVRAASGAAILRWRPLTARSRLVVAVALAAMALLPLLVGDYFLDVATEVL